MLLQIAKAQITREVQSGAGFTLGLSFSHLLDGS